MPFERFPGVDVLLGPEMRSTGEVMGIDKNFGLAFAKAEAGAGVRLPTKGTVFISVSNRDKRTVVFPAKRLSDLGFHLARDPGYGRAAPPCRCRRRDRGEGLRHASAGEKNIVERIAAGEIEMIFNTPFGRGARSDGYFIRTAAVDAGVPCITTMSGMAAAVQAIEELKTGNVGVRRLQEYLAGRCASESAVAPERLCDALCYLLRARCCRTRSTASTTTR